MPELRITTDFEGGSVEVLDCSDPGAIRLALRPDGRAPDMQWFHFRLHGARGRDCRLTFENSDRLARLAGRDEIPDCWTGYRAVASHDGAEWLRVGADTRDGIFSIVDRPRHDTVDYAYFAPYPLARYRALVDRARQAPQVSHDVLARTPDGHPIDRLTFGRPEPGRKRLWIMARQHPSETMGGWFLEGLAGRLLDPADPLAAGLREAAVIHIVPTANPDGCARGHTRTNALGMNLNRAWADPAATDAPEVGAIRGAMEEDGVDFCLDIHGDEELPYNFLGGPLEIPSRSPALRRRFVEFMRGLEAASPDYDRRHPYPGGPPAEADLRMAWNWIAERFGCLTVLLEMPFKDQIDAPDMRTGWSPQRSARLGRAMLEPIAASLPGLR